MVVPLAYWTLKMLFSNGQSRPELMKIIECLGLEDDNTNETESSNDADEEHQPHHEDKTSFEKRFINYVRKLKDAMAETNPFSDTPTDQLINIILKVVCNITASSKVKTAEKDGKEQYREYCTERLNTSKKSIYDPIKRNNISLFTDSAGHVATKTKKKISSLKSDSSLFANLFVSAITRDFDFNDLFKHENQKYPPALYEFGAMGSCTKSDALKVIEKAVNIDAPCPPTKPDASVIDGSVFVNGIPPRTSKTYKDYASSEFLPVIRNLAGLTNEVHLVFDRYMPQSI